MIDFLNNINLIHKNWIPSEKWESELLENKEKDKILIKKYSPSQKERKYAKQYAKTIINIVDKLDQQSINKSTDAMIAINTIFSLPTILAPFLGGISGYFIAKNNNVLKNQKKLSAFNGAMIGSGIYFIISQFIRSQLEKETTRIARFQSRKNELNNLSDFVVKIDKENESLIKNGFIPTSNEEVSSNLKATKSYKNAFKTLKEMKEDYKEYSKWKKDFKAKEQATKKILQKKIFTQEDLANAQKDRNKIINTIYKLELAANNEEINFQFALDLIQYAAKMSGAIIATLLCLTIPKTLTKINSQSNFIKNSKLLIPFTIPVISLYLAAVLAKFQKDSAKLGRYETKKELISNEESFITFDDFEKNNVHVKKVFLEKQGFITRIINDIKSIKTMPKRLNNMYSDYKNSENKILKKDIDLTSEQKRNAELLQKQLFYSYEKIDEKSEGFTDDMDVLLNTTKISIGTIVNVGFNIYSINLLTKKLKNFNRQKIPGFFEGLKLMKNLGRKDMINIFIVPYIIKSTLCIILDTLSATCRKKTNKIGIMTAINDLKDERVYTPEYLNNVM